MPKQQYDESSIVILEGLDAVRKRPGMYIGSTDSKGLHHLVWEIVDNAIDEALNGYGDEITITLEKDGSVTVEDHGRGMPVGKHKSGVSTLQVIFTILHAGGKFTSHGGYTSAGGLHGVGASVVNALCTWCKVMVHDGKDVWSMTFEDGGSKIGKLEKVGKTNHTGSIVSFKPDPSIFKSLHFSYSTICERAQEDAFLLKGLKMIVRDKRKEEREVVYQYEDGLKAFIEEVNQDHTPMHDPISFRGESNQIIVEGCFQYTDEYQENIFSFTNMVRTRDGGSHETGAKQAFTKVFNEYARKNGFLKEKDKGFDGNDVREGLTLVINLTIPEDYLQFEQLPSIQAEKYYTSAAQYDSQYRMLAFFNLGATMIQHKDCMEKGNQYLKKGLKSCTDDFFAVKYKEVLFVYEILKENVGDAKKLIKELDDSKYIDVFSMMLNEDYQLNVGYQNRLKELKNDSSLFKFLFIKNCEYLHKYKEICVANNFI